VKQEKLTNMLSLMLDPRFKNLHLIFSSVGLEECVSILDEYDRKTLHPMLLKCYHHLHPMTKFIGCVNQITHEDCSLDIFQPTIASTSQSTKKLVTRELLIFRHYQVNPKDIKCPFQTIPSGSQRHQMSFLDIIKWIPETSSVLFNGGENMKSCFL
jgi:hypothetical protein